MTAITINLDNSLVEWIKEFSHKNNITQKELITISLQETKKKQLEQDIKSFFWNMDEEAQQENIFFANAWLADYNTTLTNFEN